MRITALLQNAWAARPRPYWAYASWVHALRRSSSGQRLRYLFGDAFDSVTFANTTPRVGEGPDSRLPPVPGHVRTVLAASDPDVLVTFGLQAEAVGKEMWGGPLLCLPHPACRIVSNALLDEARGLLFGRRRFAGRLAIRQGTGFVTREPFGKARLAS